MKIIITEEKLNKILKRYFDDLFDDCELTVVKEYTRGRDWAGIGKTINGKYQMFVGQPLEFNMMESGNWYFNGEAIIDQSSFFDLERNEYFSLLSKYLSERYKVKITSLI